MPNSQVVNAKKKVVEENEKCYSRKDINVRKQNSHVDNMEKALMVWREEETRHIPLSQSLTKSKAPTSFLSKKAESSRKMQKEKLEAKRACFMRFKPSPKHKSTG